MIGAAGTETAQLLCPQRRRKCPRILRTVPVCDRPPVRRHHTAQVREDRRGDNRPVTGRVLVLRSPEPGPATLAFVRVDELAHLIDGADAVDVTLLLRLAPRKQAMPAENDAITARIVLDRLPQHHSQLEAGTLPRQPYDPPAVLLVEFSQLVLAVRPRSQRNRPVGM